MKKIPSLYVRDPEDMAHVTREVHERCRWVIEEPEAARATVKWDGTCVMLDETGEWWARHQVKPGKATPPLYIPVEHDPVTGRTQGWIPMSESQYRRQFAEALDISLERGWTDEYAAGTYELIGPKVGSNPHGWIQHGLIRHGETPLTGPVPTAYDDLAEWLRLSHEALGYLEGVVWHHDDGRMAKIKTKDFA